MQRILLIPALVAFAVSACGPQSELRPAPESGVLDDGSLSFMEGDSTLHTVTIEVADTEASRQRGLMNRRGISSSEGMLFIFPDPDSLSFWMRNTAIPLDILFIDENYDVVNIARRVRPLSDDRVLSTAPAKYVVEVRGGVTERYGITDDASVQWQLHNSE